MLPLKGKGDTPINVYDYLTKFAQRDSDSVEIHGKTHIEMKPAIICCAIFIRCLLFVKTSTTLTVYYSMSKKLEDR